MWREEKGGSYGRAWELRASSGDLGWWEVGHAGEAGKEDADDSVLGGGTHVSSGAFGSDP